MRKKVAIVTSGYLPLPPVEGGAVEALVQMIAEENELYNHINLTIFSVYNKKAEDEAENINERRDLIYKSMQKNFINQKHGKNAERLI